MVRVLEEKDLPNDSDGSSARACRDLHKWLQSGAITAVFCEALIGDWIRHFDKNRAFQYANILDSAPCLLEFPPGARGVPLAEALNECRRTHPELGLPQFEVLHNLCLGYKDPLLNFLSQHHPDTENGAHGPLDEQHLPGSPPKPSVAFKVESYLYTTNQNQGLWQEGVDGDKIAFNVTKKTQADASSISELHSDRWIKYWVLKALQLDVVLRSDCPSRKPEDIVAQIDLKRCPGTLLYYYEYNKYVRAKEQYNDPNDFVDQLFVPGLAYCDFATVDKRVRELITQAKRDLNISKPVVCNDVRELVTCIASQIGEAG